MQLKESNDPVLAQNRQTKDSTESTAKVEYFTAKLEQLVHHLEVMRITEYLELLQKPKQLLWTNFIAGIARGLGVAIGATVIFAVLLEVLRRLVLFNMFGIGSFMADIMKIIDTHK